MESWIASIAVYVVGWFTFPLVYHKAHPHIVRVSTWIFPWVEGSQPPAFFLTWGWPLYLAFVAIAFCLVLVSFITAFFLMIVWFVLSIGVEPLTRYATTYCNLVLPRHSPHGAA